MSGSTRKSLLAASFVFVLIVFAMSIRFLTRSDILPSSFGTLRNAIHICLLAAWGISLRSRIIQTQVRRYLLAVTAMMELWLLLKIVNYSIDNMDINRRLWYLYYVPMLFIPSAALFISMSLGRSEDYRLPRWTRLLYVPTLALLLLVLTNDSHQHVFSFPSGIMTPLNYRHETGYYIVLGWITLCALAALGMMLVKCRILRSKKLLLLPLLPLGLSLAYTAAYIRGFRPVLMLAGDMTVTQCLLIAAMFEGCIQCGLIQSNIGYNELFAATTLPIQITGSDFSAQHTSAAMQESLPQDKLQQMKSDTVQLDSDTILKRHPLHEGWVFWKEDISDLNRLGEELELTRDELRDTGDALAAENAQREKLLHLSEENRLYELMEAQTSRQVTKLQNLLEQMHGADNPELARSLLGQIIILGTYIKRRNNLIFINSQRGCISVQELRLCLNESAENLILYSTTCKAIVNGDIQLTLQQAAQIYNLFEAVVEAELPSMKMLLICVDIGEMLEVNICTDGREPLCGLKEHFPGCEWTQDEDELLYVTAKIWLNGQTDTTCGQTL